MFKQDNDIVFFLKYKGQAFMLIASELLEGLESGFYTLRFSGK
jgi:hypothetical protein